MIGFELYIKSNFEGIIIVSSLCIRGGSIRLFIWLNGSWLGSCLLFRPFIRWFRVCGVRFGFAWIIEGIIWSGGFWIILVSCFGHFGHFGEILCRSFRLFRWCFSSCLAEGRLNEFKALAANDFEEDFDSVCSGHMAVFVTESVFVVETTVVFEDDSLFWCLHGYSARSFLWNPCGSCQ